MIRIARRFAAVDPITAALGGRPPKSYLALAGFAVAAISGPIGIPTIPAGPAAPTVSSPITAGVVLTALDNAGHPLAYAQFEVYRADQPEGVQQPILPVPAFSSTGTVTVPLPQPSAIPDPDGNYFAVSTGNDVTGAPFTGIEFFNITAQQPVANAAISPNLFVQVPPVTNIGQLPPVGDPAPTGPCGYNPDTAHPPTPPAFTITTSGLTSVDGTVNVGVVYGAGSYSGNSYQADVRNTPYRAMGESLETTWSRVTQSSVVLGIDLHGLTQTKYTTAGSVNFTLATGDQATYANQSGGVSVAGQGARALVVPATWQHQTITFHCNNGDHSTETHELWQPHEWNPRGTTSTPDFPTNNDTLEGMEEQSASLVFPLQQDQWRAITAGQSQTYQNGYGASIGSGPLGLDFSVESQSTATDENKTTIYSADDCGPVNAPLCFYWAVDDAAETGCQYQMACGTDYYTAIYKTPPPVPAAPQPCSKFEPHGACD